MGSTGVLFGQVLIVFTIIAMGMWGATEWTAAQLGFQIRLGAPWFQMHGFPIYYPWRLIEWWYVYESYAPAIFNRAGIMAASSGVAAALTAMGSSVWRARQSRLVTTFGSARWATEKEIKAAGLHEAAGVFLGRE